MLAVKSLVICFFVTLISAHDDLLTPCLPEDLECIKIGTKRFMEKTSEAVPVLGLKGIDPLKIDYLVHPLPNFQLKNHFHNLKITGLKDLQITFFKRDSARKTVEMGFNSSVLGSTDFNVEYRFHSESKYFNTSATFKLEFQAECNYPYKVYTDDKGVVHYEAGQETAKINIWNPSEFTVDNKFIEALKADKRVTEGRPNILDDKDTYLHDTQSAVVHTIVKTLINNIRQAAKTLPASAFFKLNDDDKVLCSSPQP